MTGKSDATSRSVGRGRTGKSSVTSTASAAPLKRAGLDPNRVGGATDAAARVVVPLTSSASCSAITIDCDPECIVLDDDDEADGDDSVARDDLLARGPDADVADDEYEIIERSPLSSSALLTSSSSSSSLSSCASARSFMPLLSTSVSGSTASSLTSPYADVPTHAAVREPQRSSTTNAFEVMARAAAAASSSADSRFDQRF